MPRTAKPRTMPKFTRSPEELVPTFDNALKDFPMAERRKMFSYPAAFANSQLFAGLFQDEMFVRLPEPERTRFLSRFKTKHFAPLGHAMREYVVVPPDMLKSPLRLRNWLGKALAYAQSLPPKVKAKKTR